MTCETANVTHVTICSSFKEGHNDGPREQETKLWVMVGVYRQHI